MQGNLLYTQSRDRISHYAYDANDRLIAAGIVPAATAAHGVAVAATTDKNGTTPRTVAGEGASFSRYFYDSTGNRVLAQEAVSSQEDTSSHTIKTHYAAGSNRWQESTAGKDAADSADIRYDASGQPRQIGEREYVWNALGKLVEVRQQKRTLASYRYNNSGLRISKTAGGHTTYYLYENRQLSAELNEQGRVTRQYIYAAEQPVAIIDTPQGTQTATQDSVAMLAQVGHDLVAVFKSWVSAPAQIAYLHTNHLGAAELVTDDSGNAVWRAEYQPYGKLVAVSAAGRSHAASGKPGSNGAPAFRLNLRLPGQYEDDETGLYYNDHRYYDPARGRYLTPDPLGLGGGINSYAYVSGNPLKYIDPTGLILFAFDGTENTDDVAWLDAKGSSLSNVVEFRNLYQGRARYITGVGTVDKSDPSQPILAPDKDIGFIPRPDRGFNWSGAERITRMIKYFKDEADLATDDNAPMEVDIIGFSRGAANARDFANQIVAATDSNGLYHYKDAQGKEKCQKVHFRFMGLWDTVLSTNWSGHNYNLDIPKPFAYVAQAVALNEFRGHTRPDGRPDPHNWDTWGAFPLESIGPSSSTPGQVRVERGFLGAHADIGGGFGKNENDLAKVALAWMVQQAVKAGVTVNVPSLTISANPVLHDKSTNIQTGRPLTDSSTEDRVVRYADGTKTTQRKMKDIGMTYADTDRFIKYTPREQLERNNYPRPDADGNMVDHYEYMTNQTGKVDVAGYLEWLGKNNYDLGNLTVQ